MTMPFETADYWRVGAAIRRHGAAEGVADVPVAFHIPIQPMTDCATTTCERAADRRIVHPADAPTDDGRTRALCLACVEAMHYHGAINDGRAGFRAEALDGPTTRHPNVTGLEQTTEYGPRQWEGVTEDGYHVYARWRFGAFSAGVGVTPEEAVRYQLVATNVPSLPTTADVKRLLFKHGWSFPDHPNL